MVGEALRPDAQLLALLFRGESLVATLRVFAGAGFFARLRQAVGLVIGATLGNRHLHVAIALLVHERAARRLGTALRAVDRQLMEIDRAKPR